MTQYDTTGPGGNGERWNVNLPAVVGVVFVFLVGVIVWVVMSGGDDEPGAISDVATTVTAPEVSDGGTTALTTTPAMPDVTSTMSTSPTETPTETTTTSTSTTSTTTTLVETTVAATSTVPVTTVPVTAAPGADPDAVPGDLAIPGHPMRRPGCDGSYITILASAVGGQATATGMEAHLDSYPSSAYLRTDQTCSSLRSDIGGQPIYVVYFGPFALLSDACVARAAGPPDAYAKQLSNEVSPVQVVNCG